MKKLFVAAATLVSCLFVVSGAGARTVAFGPPVKVTPGLGQMPLDLHRPFLPAAEPVDDRPWVAAHGNGHVFYFGNEGDKVTYPLGQGTGSGFGPGRYTVYRSYDGGQTFDTLGYTLKD